MACGSFVINTIVFLITVHKLNTQGQSVNLNWTDLEKLGEEYPYTVGLVDENKQYLCTGAAITKHAILTSGRCITDSLRYVTVGTCTINQYISSSNYASIVSYKIYNEYNYELGNRIIKHLHNNIALVFIDDPVLGFFIQLPTLSNYYAGELMGQELTVVGYGNVMGLKSIFVLQRRKYREETCINPKWFYCVCGLEVSGSNKSYMEMFGEGGPVLLGSKIIGVTAAPCGSLYMPSTNISFNVFTAIAPYVSWIQNSIRQKVKRSVDSTYDSASVIKISPALVFLTILLSL